MPSVRRTVGKTVGREATAVAEQSPVTRTMLGVHNASERCEHPGFLFLLIIIYVASRF